MFVFVLNEDKEDVEGHLHLETKGCETRRTELLYMEREARSNEAIAKQFFIIFEQTRSVKSLKLWGSETITTFLFLLHRIYLNTPKTATRRCRGAAGAPPLAARDREKGARQNRSEDQRADRLPPPQTLPPLPTPLLVGGQGPRKVTADTRKWMRENLLLMITLSGVLFGVILGFGLRPLGLGEDAVMLISYPGELFMRILKLMILPLVIASLISGSASLNARMNGMIAIRTLVYFILTSFLNAVIGVILVLVIHPGNPGIRESITPLTHARAVNILDSLLDLGRSILGLSRENGSAVVEDFTSKTALARKAQRNMFPDNLFQAAFQQAHTVYVPRKPPIQNQTDGLSVEVVGEKDLIRVIQYRSGTNTLGIVFFCLVFGTFLGTLGEKGQVVIDFFKAVFEVIMRMVSTAMWVTPVGITSVIAGKILGVDDLALVMSQLAWFIVTIVIGVFFYQLVVMQLIYLAFVRKNPFRFYAGLAQGTLTAFAMASTQPSGVALRGRGPRIRSKIWPTDLHSV
uniref:Amino acid transporter n=1 Tax=Vespula pensylvanica TaxID=30213 RepID=A0A834NQP9_VESPE|nr:hypothetical protein H0235_012309 [Vespula pensylvanica]